MKSLIIISIAIIISSVVHSKTLSVEDIVSLPFEEIEEHLVEQEPSVYYLYAARIFDEKSREKGIFWYYVGEIRFRFMLTAEPDPDPSAGPALLGALQYAVGERIKRYAGAHPDILLEQIAAAIEWDRTHPNKHTSKEKYSKEHKEVIDGLKSLKEYIIKNKKELLTRDEMPKDWPPLRKLHSIDDLAGAFSVESFTRMPIWLIGREYLPKEHWLIDVVEIRSHSDETVEVIAFADGSKVASHVIKLTEKDEGFMFWNDYGAEESEMYEGGTRIEITLFRNVEEHLVFRWMFKTFGKQMNRSLPIEEVEVLWDKADVIRESNNSVEDSDHR